MVLRLNWSRNRDLLRWRGPGEIYPTFLAGHISERGRQILIWVKQDMRTGFPRKYPCWFLMHRYCGGGHCTLSTRVCISLGAVHLLYCANLVQLRDKLVYFNVCADMLGLRSTLLGDFLSSNLAEDEVSFFTLHSLLLSLLSFLRSRQLFQTRRRSSARRIELMPVKIRFCLEGQGEARELHCSADIHRVSRTNLAT
jgi:hypothetical protein